MTPALIVALVVGSAVVGAVAGGVVGRVAGGRAAQAERSTRADRLREAQEAIAALQTRVDALTSTSGAGRSVDYLITTMADEALEPAAGSAGALSGREFTSVAVGESVVRVASLAHGVRRALSPRSRARIGFEMRQELKRTRRQRRVDLKAARRRLRTHGEPASGRDRDRDAA